jgi:DNA-binding IclR family transcriptional regulator
MCVERTRSQLERADVILEAFDARHEYLTLLGLVERTGLPKTTVHRTVKKMLELGWVECRDGHYTIGIRLFERAALAARPTSLRDAALQPLQGLRSATLETVHLAVLDGAEVVYLEKLTGHRPIGTSSRVGGRMPALCTALGKVLTAFRAEVAWSGVGVPVARTAHTLRDPGEIRNVLARARREGVAYDREEADLGVHCVAAPVTAPDGTCIAALSVTGPAGRLDFCRLAPAVSSAAHQASRVLATRAGDRFARSATEPAEPAPPRRRESDG